MLSAIVCLDNYGGIGKDGALIYKIPEDIKRFKELTIGHPIIMGRKTWNSIGNKPLKGRNNIVLSKTLNYSMIPIREDDDNITKVNIWRSIPEEEIKAFASATEEYFVIGGRSIYEMFLPYCEKVYATIVNSPLSYADTFFPINSLEDTEKWIESDISYDSEGLAKFITYTRKKDIKETDDVFKSHAYIDPVVGHNAVENPSHYCGTKYQAIDFIEDQGLGYCLGNVTKYVCRAGKKYPGDKQKELQDLKKAQWYLNRRIEEHENGIETDQSEFAKFKIKLPDFIADQKLNNIRGNILYHITDWIGWDEMARELSFAYKLLDIEITRVEEELKWLH